MKTRLAVLAASILLLGAGCLGATQVTTAPVTGDWLLAFDLPENWVTTAPYQEGNTLELDKQISPSDSEIILQSTNKWVFRSSGGPAPEGVTDLQETDFVYISVLHLDPHRIIPEEAQDLGNGFSKVKLCEANEDCRIGGRLNYDYYYKTNDGNYKFEVYLNGREASEAEAVIMSAKKVTVPNQ